MLVRVLFLGLLAVMSVGTMLTGPLQPQQAAAAPQVSPLTFSSGVTDRFEPIDPRVYFDSDNNGVYVTFSFSDLPPGSQLTRIVRFNGEDYNYDSDRYGHLNCCAEGGSGRYGFRVVRLSGAAGELPGGAYEVRLYLDGQEIQAGGFGVRGDDGSSSAIPGDDEDDDNGNDDENDND